MRTASFVRRTAALAAAGALALAGSAAAVRAQAQAGTGLNTAACTQKFQPQSGQSGKDVVWVPTPEETVKKMLDMGQVTPTDLVIDLGSGDGRTVIAAAKRGATAIGVEYNPEMVALSRCNIDVAKITNNKATIVEGDLFKYDFSKATVVTMFLLPSINMRLRPQILDMKPGTRIVTNSFDMEDWTPDETAQVGEPCQSWCRVNLWIVPAKVAGTWHVGSQALTLTQQFQNVTGTLGSSAISNGKLRGDQITFNVGTQKYTGKVNGNTITGTGPGGAFTATKG
jgi:hypothetical protein